MSGLVLSLFPGIGMLDMGFELEGFCVVRGPDLLWGGDVRVFHPPVGKFEGVIGGPPCQSFSPIGNVNKARWGVGSVMPDLIPEFRRIVLKSNPSWWVMENSPRAYSPFREARHYDIKNEWLGEDQGRHRRFWSNLILRPELPVFGNQRPQPVVCSKGSVDWKGSRTRIPKRTLAEMCRLQGLPPDWLDHQPWTMQARRKMVGNGVPIPMARAIARAVRKALEADSLDGAEVRVGW